MKNRLVIGLTIMLFLTCACVFAQDVPGPPKGEFPRKITVQASVIKIRDHEGEKNRVIPGEFIIPPGRKAKDFNLFSNILDRNNRPDGVQHWRILSKDRKFNYSHTNNGGMIKKEELSLKELVIGPGEYELLSTGEAGSIVQLTFTIY